MNKVWLIKKLTIVLIILFSYQTVSSQVNYIPGYVINNSNDTLFGLVDYRNWEKNPDRVRFKTNAGDDPVLFGPLDILEFSVEDEIYISAIVDVEISPINTNNLEGDPGLRLVRDTTFLQTIIKGEKSLYHNNKDGKSNFYIFQDTGFELLEYKKYITSQNGVRIINENTRFKNQLALYLRDCPTLQFKIEKVSYNQKSLVKFFREYYECVPSEINFEKRADNIKLETGALSGASLTHLNFFADADIHEYLAHANYDSSIDPSMGIFFDVIFPRNQGKWSLYNELLFTTYELKGRFEEIESEQIQTFTTTEFSYQYMNFNNMIRFKYPIGAWFLFLQGGISNGFSLREKNYKKDEIKFYNEFRVVEGPAIKYNRSHEQGYILGTGVKRSRFSIEFRYERGNGMSDFQDLNSKTESYYFLLGLRI